MYTNNESVEQAFLWSILFDNSIMQKTILEEEDFVWEKNQLVFRMFKWIVKAWKNITPIIFQRILEREKLIEKIWYTYLADLDIMCESSIFWKWYEKEIKENSNNNKIQIIKEWINENNIYDSIKKLNDIWSIEERGSWVIDLVDSVWDLLDEYKNRWQMLWYKWPFAVIDKYVWWIISWKVYTIIAYSNVWKTSFSYNYIVNALKEWKRVKVFSTEEQKNKVFLNIIKAYYWKTINDYMKDYMINMEDFEYLTVYDNLYKIDDILKETKKDDVIFIDFIQNLKVHWNWEYEQMTNAAIELQRKAIQDNNIIFVLSQVNNESRNREANYMQPKWSWAIFASSDVILALYKEQNELKLNLLKNKFWPNNIIFLVEADFSRLQFQLTEEDKTQNLKTDYNF